MLHTAITILNDPVLIKEDDNLKLTHNILRTFVIKFAEIYGLKNVTFM